MRTTLEQKLPPGLHDDLAHCLAAGLIARYCSRSEAWMASVGKEIRDATGDGDAEWRDLTSDRRGMRCASAAASDEQLRVCCESQSGEPRN